LHGFVGHGRLDREAKRISDLGADQGYAWAVPLRENARTSSMRTSTRSPACHWPPAARAVGKTPRSAYQLRDKDGAESFAAAWEAAKFAGRDHAAQIAIERALYGEMVPLDFARGPPHGFARGTRV
jgi:hypothetical protein